MTLDNDNDVNVYFRQALRAPLLIPAYFSVVLTGLNFMRESNAQDEPIFHKYSRILSVLISTNLWAISQILSFSDSQFQKRRHSVTSLLADLVLQHKDFFLSFNLTTQFFFRRHKSQISRCIKLISRLKHHLPSSKISFAI